MSGALWAGLLALQAAGGTDVLSIRFIGNAAFVLSDGQTTLVTDFPYRSGAFGYMEYDASAAPAASVTAVITHRHADHFDSRLFTRHDWRLIGPPDVVASVPSDRVLTADGPVRIGDFLVTPVSTPHGDVQHWSYEIRWRDRRLYFTGDTDTPDHLIDTPRVDVAFVTPWLSCTIRDRGLVIPATLIVLHHQFPDDRSRICGQPRQMKQGEVLTLPADKPGR